MSAVAAVTLRPFEERDYGRMLEIRNTIFTDYRASERELRHWDSSWEADKYFRRRVVAEDAAGYVVAFGQVSHIPHQFHADRYELDIQVNPPHQRCGTGRTLYDHLMGLAQERGATQIRTQAKESMPESVAWIGRRGFSEIQRYWESRLEIGAFDFAQFAGAEERAAREGITIATLAEEGLENEAVRRKLYELDRDVSTDIPMPDPMTHTSFEAWAKNEFSSPNLLPEAWFIAKDGDAYVGISNLWKSQELEGVYHQGLTGVRREYRGKGIAMALKVRGLRHMRDAGIREVRTWNNTRNRPMLRINEAMGFQKQPVWIEFAKEL
jgi:GNAT superfamily N-acetyltransferase